MCKVAFRADGSPKIGMGHIMRCLSLAGGFREAGCKVWFLSKYRDGMEKIKEMGFEVIRLECGELECDETGNTEGFYYGSTRELDREAEEIAKAIGMYGIDLLFIDSYNVDAGYFLKLRPYVRKLGYIDDVNSFSYPVDILVNGNITGQYFDYKKYYENEEMLLGPRYNLIRDEFRNLPERTVRREVREIMITTGGADPYNMSEKIISALLDDDELGSLRYNVVVGSAFHNKEQLKNIGSKHSNVVLYENVTNMSEIMLRSDMAVSAGGSTLYELCACGTPALAFIMADNQRDIVEKMSESGYIESLGWYDILSESILQGSVRELSKNYDKRKTFSRKMRQLIDGRGVYRVVERTLELLK